MVGITFKLSGLSRNPTVFEKMGCKKVNKGVWGMPRLLEAKKDVVSCDKPRGFANKN